MRTSRWILRKLKIVLYEKTGARKKKIDVYEPMDSLKIDEYETSDGCTEEEN